ncbi:MAG: HU family DNA-binding protein [Hyphomicrobiaceae bacterium]
MSKKELIDAMAERADIPKDKAAAALDAALAYIESTLKAGGEVSIPPLGKFKTSERKARDGRNPATGETIKIPASRAPKFQPAKALKDALNK